MNKKDYLTNRAFCPIPWTGIMYNFDGMVKNCIRSKNPIGNLHNESFSNILNGKINLSHKESMLEGKPVENCNPCYVLEQKTKDFEAISDRIFYLKELKEVDTSLYADTNNFDLNTIDIRWSNLCNFACIYCSAEFSSKWASELGINVSTPPKENVENLKDYVFSNAKNLKHVYLAGGEPLLMKENLELLEILKRDNPNINLRVNTNLSKVDTKIFDLICEFKNVHWTVSVETIEDEYEYIRYPGTWIDFLDNLRHIAKLNHKISFNMLHFALNYRSIFKCIDFLQKMEFHNNSFIVGPVLGPPWWDIRNLPDEALSITKELLQEQLNLHPKFLLANGLKNMLIHISLPYEKNLTSTVIELFNLDSRRKLNSKNIFLDFYKWTN